MKRFSLLLIVLVAIALVAFAHNPHPGPRPKPTDDLGQAAAKLDRVLSELETLLDSPPWNQTSIQSVSVNGEEISRIETINGKIRRTVSRTRRFDESTR